MLQLCRELFYDLNNSPIKYCHWKSNLRLCQALSGQEDLDILIDSNQVSELTSFLAKHGFKHAQSQYGSIYNGIEDWIGFDCPTGNLVHLHLHYKLTTGISRVKNATLPWADYGLEHTEMSEMGVKIICPEMEIILLYIRNIFKMKIGQRTKCRLWGYVFSEHDRQEIEYLKKRINRNKMLTISSELFAPNNAHLIADLLCKNSLDKSDLPQLGQYCGDFLKGNLNSGYLYANILSITRENIIRYRNYQNRRRRFIPVKKTFSHGGRIIAIIGADGTGKTTITKALLKWLSWKLDARTSYLGSGDGYKSLLKTVVKDAAAINKRHGGSNKSNVEGPEQRLAITWRKYLGRYLACLNLIVLARRKERLLARLNIYRNLGGIAIVDRYPQTQFQGIYDGPKVETVLADFDDSTIKRSLVNIEKNHFKVIAAVRPDIVFKLILSPEISLQRKPDHNIAEITRKADITKELAFPKSKIHEIDVNRNIEDILLDIKKIIWEAI